MLSQIYSALVRWPVVFTFIAAQMLFLIEVESLNIHSIEVPAAVMNSSQVTLVCNYSLQNEQLYSVKWYKNYVEFYRFQPLQADNSGLQSQGDNQQQQQQQHSKQEFELDGISLNAAYFRNKINSQRSSMGSFIKNSWSIQIPLLEHLLILSVSLGQNHIPIISLTSFNSKSSNPMIQLSKSNATHVFLKQTNLNSEGTYKCEVSADSPSFATVSIERKMKVYVLPKQKLLIVDNNLATTQHNFHQAQQQQIKQANTYHINDTVNLTCISAHSHPSARLTWFINHSPVINSSRWLTHHQPSKLMLNQQNEQQYLMESRLTLSFKIQPYHLSKDNSLQLYPTAPQRHQFLRLRCLAMLSLEFDSETVISVLSGKRNVNKKNRSSQIAASSLQLDNLREVETTPPPYMSRLSILPQSMTEEQEEKFKATSTSHQIHVGNRISANLSDLELYEYRWPQSTIDSPHKVPSERRNSFPNAWITSPATTATPTLPSTSIQDSELITDLSIGNRLNNNRVPMRQPSIMVSVAPASWTSKQIKLQSEFIDERLQFTHANELDTPTIEARLIQEIPDSSDDGEETRSRISPPSDSDISSASMFDDTFTGEPEARATFNQASMSETSPPPDLDDQNYELNDMVQFTCNPRVAFSDRNDVRKRIQSSWFINNKEINARQINSFDGSKFYHTRDIQLDSSHSTSLKQNSTLINPNKEKKPYKAESISLIFEFTPSLFQIKELNLKCRTIVEQPLIEFEQQLVISIPLAVSSNQHQFIQTIDQRQKNPTTRNQPGSNNRQNKRRDRNRDGLAQLSPSSSGTVGLSTIDGLELRPIIILIYSLALINCFLIQFSNVMKIGRHSA